MKRIPQSFLVVAFLTTAGLIGLAPLHGQAAERQRGVLSNDAPAEPKPVGPYYALVIGNNEYQKVPHLLTAVNDATEVSQLLRDRFGFKTQVLYNATRAQVLEAIDSYRSLPADSNLLLYYAGHGYRDKDANRAYWLPIDADKDQRPNWINSTDITDGIHAIKSRHVLIISDSCFSGDLVLRDAKAAIASGGHNAIVAKALNLNSRHVMASGGDEPVADNGTGGHSVFAAALLESLNDMQEDVFRGNDLFDRVKPRVEMRSEAKQTPRYDILRDSFGDLGDFVFFRSSPRGPSKSTEAILIEARKLFTDKQYDRALPLFRGAADASNGEAATFLGYMYETGLGGLAKDDAQAVTWYHKAADAGDPTGMVDLGHMYATGRGGLAKDEAQAVAWYRKAADAGQLQAMTDLGYMYETGQGGLSKDDVQAVGWYQRAATAGEPYGMTSLGYMYESGRGGLAKDQTQAASLYRKAANAGVPRAMTNLGHMYQTGQSGLPKDTVQAVGWYQRAAAMSYPPAMTNLGYMYATGQGVAKDDVQAVSWYRKAADAGDSMGMNNLGYAYETGQGGLPKDDAQAVTWYRKAADAGYAGAMTNLGSMYSHGRSGLPKDDVEAVRWYRKAADAGDGVGMAGLGAMYSQGRGGLPKDDVQAVEWFRKAVQAGSRLGMRNLAVMYEQGLGGLPKDQTQAIYWYRKAADLGEEGAKEALKRLQH